MANLIYTLDIKSLNNVRTSYGRALNAEGSNVGKLDYQLYYGKNIGQELNGVSSIGRKNNGEYLNEITINVSNDC